MKEAKTGDDMAAFLTADIAEEGKRFDLCTPAGETTSHWLMVRGIDAQEFRRTREREYRKSGEIAGIEKEKEREDALELSKLLLIASLIHSWSFSQPCTTENKVAFLRKAPQIADGVERLAGRRSFFFKKPAPTSKDTPPPSSD